LAKNKDEKDFSNNFYRLGIILAEEAGQRAQ
jgi:hypothetical protein